MQGVYIYDETRSNVSRPKSKKQIKELVKSGKTNQVRLEATSFFGNEYDGLLSDAPLGDYYVVGPDPHTKRNFYGRITVHADRIVVQ